MPDDDAIGHKLGQNGYRTGYIGKWHLYSRNASEMFTPPGPYRLGFDQYYASYSYNNAYWDGFYYLDTPDLHRMHGYQTDVQTDMAIDFIEASAQAGTEEHPFALFVSYEVPHPPCTRDNVPASDYEHFAEVDFSDLLIDVESPFRDFDEPFDRQFQQKNVVDGHQERCRSYFAMTARLDINIARLCSALEQNGLAENTILVFSSDHGDMLGSYGRINKRIFLERSTRVPMIVRWPAGIPGRRRVPYLLNTPDIAPTLLELVGIDPPTSYEGESIAGILRDPDVANDDRKWAFLQNLAWGKFNRHEEYRALRSHEFLYAKMTRTGKEFLFDLRRPGAQLVNVIAEPALSGVVAEARDGLASYMQTLGDTPQTMEWYRDHWIEEECVVRSARSASTG